MAKWNPEDYAEHSSAQWRFAMDAISKLRLRGDEWVLDLGCGDGKITAELAKLLPRGKALGIDSSPEMIAFAREKFPAGQWPNLSFEVMDASAIAFEEKFDLVFSNAALHWILDHRPVLKGIYQSLKPGGKVQLQMAGKGNLAAIAPAIARVIGDPRWKDGFRNFKFPYGFFSPEEYKVWLAESGLRPLRVELVPRQIIQKGRAGMAAWIRTTWLPILECIPEQHRETFIAAVVESYLVMRPLEDGLAVIPSMRLEVEAVK